MISIVQSPKSSLSYDDEQVNKIIRSPIFQRKNFESLQKQQEKSTSIKSSNNLKSTTTTTTTKLNSNNNIGGVVYAKKSNLLSGGNLDENQKRLIRNANEALQENYPKKSSQGVGGGVYFISGSNSIIAVFKPMDEEAGLDEYIGADSHPMKRGMKSGTLVGEGPLKEVAVYMFDQLHQGRFKVPVTTLVEISHPLFGAHKKIGSLQEYVVYEDSAEEFGCSKFSIEDTHRIGILDSLILNLDRHSGNLLVVAKEDEEDGGDQNNNLELIPIDHSLSLPSSDALSDAWFDWLNFPQSKISFSQAERDFIMSLDADSDIQQLHSKLPKLKLTSLETLKITITFLKAAVQENLNLYEIGRLISRSTNLDQPSTLELIVTSVNLKINSKNSHQKHQSKNHHHKLYNQLFWSTLKNDIHFYLKNQVK